MAPDPPVEQLPYWGKCKKMDFRRLQLFISDSLAALSRPGYEDVGPRSKNEFLALCDMLRRKLDTTKMPEIPPLPPPPPEFPRYTYSKHLKSLLHDRKLLKGTLKAESRKLSALKGWEDKSEVKQRIKEIQRELKVLDKNFEQVMIRERQVHEGRRATYIRTHVLPYNQRYLRPHLEAKNVRRRWIQQRNKQLEILEKVRKNIEHAFASNPDPPMKHLGWRVLPPGELSAETIRQHYEILQRKNPDVRYDGERITKALSLRPDEYYVGIDEFEGYIVLTFAHTPRVLMECPVFGNAIYIIESDWKRLSKLSKRELLTNFSGQVTKIVHKGDWFRRAKLELSIR